MPANAPTCFRVHAEDNVATLLEDAEQGNAKVLGEGNEEPIALLESIPRGHKVSLAKIAAADPIIKYGIVIGEATAPINRGQHIHLHNCRSLFDSRSSTLDQHDGTPSDTPYE